MNAPLVSVRDLKVHFDVGRRSLLGRGSHRVVKSVDGVSFDIYPGETLGLVGEPAGQDDAGRAMLRLVEPTSGRVLIRDLDVTALRAGELRRARRHMQMIFRDPYLARPRMTVGQIIAEPIDTFDLAGAPRVRRGFGS
jgi:ABC-type glutathione transport system ATPase component